MLLRRLALGALPSFAALVLLAPKASAQLTASVTILTNSIRRTVPFRTDPTTKFWINRAECIAGDSLIFPVVLTGGSTSTFEVWASTGVDCRDSTNRTSASAGCWRVFHGPTTPSAQDISIKVQDIAAMKKPPVFADSVGDASSCTQSSSTAQPLSLYFMFISGSENQGGSLWSTKLDLAAPTAPVMTQLGPPGDTLLKPVWTSNSDPDVAGYDFFCEGSAVAATNSFGPGAGDSGSGTAGSGGSGGASSSSSCADASTMSVDDADTDATSTDASDEQTCTTPSTGTGAGGSTGMVASSCGSTKVVQGAIPDATFAVFACGGVTGQLATSASITGLTNGVTYAVGIAARDAVGNIGALSNVICETPGPVNGFAQAYNAAGGTAGGGFCAVGRLGKGDRGYTWGFALLGAGLWVARRRRQAARRVDTAFDRTPIE